MGWWGSITEAEVKNQNTFDRSRVKPLALQYSWAESSIPVLLSRLTGSRLCEIT